jgi:glycolate oxidase
LDTQAGALLLFGDDGEPDFIDAAVDKMAQIAAEVSGSRGVTLAADTAAADALLYARRCSLPALARLGTLSILEDISVPRPIMSDAVKGINEIGEKNQVLIGTFGHAGDGNLHINILKDDMSDEQWDITLPIAIREIFELTVSLGGTLSGEHGIGWVQKNYMDIAFNEVQLNLMKKIKEAFDPNGILNPGKIFPD